MRPETKQEFTQKNNALSQEIANGHKFAEAIKNHELADQPRAGRILRRVNAKIAQLEQRFEPRAQLPEFGPLSRVDIMILAQALDSSRSFLDKMLEQRGLHLPAEEMLIEFSSLTGNIRIPGLTDEIASEETKLSAFTLNERKSVFRKTKEFLDTYDFEEDSEEIKSQHLRIYYFLRHLKKIDTVISGRISNQSTIRSGFDLLTELLKNDEPRKRRVTVRNQTGKNVHISIREFPDIGFQVVVEEVADDSLQEALNLEKVQDVKPAKAPRVPEEEIIASLEELISATLDDPRLYQGATRAQLEEILGEEIAGFDFDRAVARTWIVEQGGRIGPVSVAIIRYLSECVRVNRELTHPQRRKLRELGREIYLEKRGEK